MPEIQNGQYKDGKPCVLVKTPYHPEAVEAFRNLMGTWDSYHRWWVIRCEHRAKIEAIVARFWPSDENKVERIYRFSSDSWRHSSPQIDQLDVVSFSGHVKHQDVIEILENSLTTDGSRRSRTLKGTLVVRARVRPEATATWVGATAEMVYSSEVADRLLKQVFGDE